MSRVGVATMRAGEEEAAHEHEDDPVVRVVMRVRVFWQSAPGLQRASRLLSGVGLIALALIILKTLTYATAIHTPMHAGFSSMLWLPLAENPRVGLSPGVRQFSIREFSRTCCELGPSVYRASTTFERWTKYYGKGERGIYDYKEALRHFLASGQRMARVFVPMTMMDDFVRDFFLPLPDDTRIVLVTGQEDCGPAEIFGFGRASCRMRIPISLPMFVLDPRLVHWFAQNYDFEHCDKIAAIKTACSSPRLPPLALAKLSPIPIGMDYHTDSEKANLLRISPARQEVVLNKLANLNWSSKQNRILAVFTLGTNSADRGKLLSVLDGRRFCVRHPRGRVQKRELWKSHASIGFVFCPQGNGIDTHRVYEALNLGSVPVVRSSPLDGLYKQFPIIILDSWDSFTSCDQLSEWRQEIKARFGKEPFFNPEVQRRLTLEYWASLTVDVFLPVDEDDTAHTLEV
ncbi:Hypothetical Protein FCC1311_084112 [Hondaea fermentalgiana]|uniref:Exostosin GT47 domain-containing protein n=1 Tax=Hondaea fermentalgiana TaxID=2315210 RepID=A0A2R5GMS0_9STRA|nr:Hypothetical Protein FCC1311_084112 [Hondaea fermentalgiana]|eukprot:GBG32186.1 Hypothetical Protein FCC1311_084112 [Hondaea fermentalgiana]